MAFRDATGHASQTVADVTPVSARLEDVREVLGEWGRSLVTVIAILYAAGFVVVNSYLGSFGVRDLEPLQTRYVAAAVPFLGLAALAAFFGLKTEDAMIRMESGRSSRLRALLLVARLPAVVVVVSLTMIVALSLLRASVLFPTEASLTRLSDIVWFSVGPVLAVLAFRARRHDWHTWQGASLLVAPASSVILGLVAYANTIYPSIPTWLGGGRPDTVQLVVEDGATVCPPCAGPVKLIDADSNRVVLLVERPDGARVALEISRSAVRSITHSAVPPR